MPPGRTCRPSPEATALFSLEGKVALLTGATRGIGLSIATEMARAGAFITGPNLIVDGGTIIDDGN